MATKKWSNIRATRDAEPDIKERRDKARADLERELRDYEQTLADLRRARGLTQVQMAKALSVSQAQVSRIETQTDLYLSTLRSYVEAMGGELQLVAVFADREPAEVELEDLRRIEEDAPDVVRIVGLENFSDEPPTVEFESGVDPFPFISLDIGHGTLPRKVYGLIAADLLERHHEALKEAVAATQAEAVAQGIAAAGRTRIKSPSGGIKRKR